MYNKTKTTQLISGSDNSHLYTKQSSVDKGNNNVSENQEESVKYSLRGVLHPKDGGDIDGTRAKYNRRVGIPLYNNVCIVYRNLHVAYYCDYLLKTCFTT